MWGHGMTLKRLEKMKTSCFNDYIFWEDILHRHGGIDKTPTEMSERDLQQYDHCFGNFMGMLMDMMYRKGVIK